MRADLGALAPELILLVGAVLVLVVALVTPRRVQPWCAALAILTLLGAAGSTWHLLGNAARLVFGGTFAVDRMTVLATLVIVGATAVVVALSVGWFATDARQGEYYAILLMSALGATLLAGAADVMELTLAVLLSSATGYVLVAYHRASRRAAEGAIKYYLLGALANGGMVYGIVLLFGLAGTTTYTGLRTGLHDAHALPLVAATTLLLVGLAFKMGAAPTHAWMPDVADGAPAPVAAFVTAVPKVGALVALARLLAVVPESQSGWRLLVAVIAAATMTIGNLAALWQDDVRRLLGWSAVSQTGYGLLAVVAVGRSALALPALVLFLVAYVLGNLAAFAVVIALRGEARRARYAGLGWTSPLLSAALVTSFLSFVGIPPLAGFGAKLALFGTAIEAGYGWLAVIAVANTVVSLAYYGRVMGPMYFERAEETTAPDRHRLVHVAVWGTTAGLVLVGLAAELVLGTARGGALLP